MSLYKIVDENDEEQVQVKVEEYKDLLKQLCDVFDILYTKEEVAASMLKVLKEEQEKFEIYLNGLPPNTLDTERIAQAKARLRMIQYLEEELA